MTSPPRLHELRAEERHRGHLPRGVERELHLLVLQRLGRDSEGVVMKVLKLSRVPAPLQHEGASLQGNVRSSIGRLLIGACVGGQLPGGMSARPPLLLALLLSLLSLG